MRSQRKVSAGARIVTLRCSQHLLNKSPFAQWRVVKNVGDGLILDLDDMETESIAMAVANRSHTIYSGT